MSVFKYITTFVLILATLAGVAGAADAAAPGDMLYTLDQRIETIQRQVYQNLDSQAAFESRIAEERMQEAGQLINSGSIEVALTLLGAESGVDLSGNQLIVSTQEVQTAGEEPETIENPGTYCAASTEAQHPVLARLADIYGVSYSTMANWYCLGFGPGDIVQAYTISAASGTPVEVLFAQAQEGYDWGEISRTARAGNNLNAETLGAYCDANGKHIKDTQHPQGLALSETIGVSYETVMGWYCQKNSFGEIRLAYTLSEKSGLPITEIFNMHYAGMSWGALTQQLNLNGKPAAKPTAEETTAKPTRTPKPPKP